jgi:hypothetical protein
MPRKKLIRRFDPRYGVSLEMLESESKYVAREREDYLLLATNDLKEKLERIRECWSQADRVLEQLLHELPDRDKLASAWWSATSITYSNCTARTSVARYPRCRRQSCRLRSASPPRSRPTNGFSIQQFDPLPCFSQGFFIKSPVANF